MSDTRSIDEKRFHRGDARQLHRSGACVGSAVHDKDVVRGAAINGERIDSTRLAGIRAAEGDRVGADAQALEAERNKGCCSEGAGCGDGTRVLRRARRVVDLAAGDDKIGREISEIVVAAVALIHKVFDAAGRRLIEAGDGECGGGDFRRVGGVVELRGIDRRRRAERNTGYGRNRRRIFVRGVDDVLGAGRFQNDLIAHVAGTGRWSATGDEDLGVPGGGIRSGFLDVNLIVASQRIDEQIRSVNEQHICAVVDRNGEILDAVQQRIGHAWIAWVVRAVAGNDGDDVVAVGTGDKRRAAGVGDRFDVNPTDGLEAAGCVHAARVFGWTVKDLINLRRVNDVKDISGAVRRWDRRRRP